MAQEPSKNVDASEIPTEMYNKKLASSIEQLLKSNPQGIQINHLIVHFHSEHTLTIVSSLDIRAMQDKAAKSVAEYTTARDILKEGMHVPSSGYEKGNPPSYPVYQFNS